MEHGAVVSIKTKEEWDAALKKADAEGKTVVVDFTAVWCGPCRMIGPVFVQHSTKFPTIVFLKVDVDEVPAVAEACSVSAMPTFQVFKGGKKVDELVGASPPKLEELLKKHA